MNDNNWDKKRKKIREKLKNYPEDGYVWLEYGDFLVDECDNPIKTVQAYEKAAELLKDKDLRLRLGVAYDNAGQTEKGISVITESLNDNPRPNGYCILAEVYLKSNLFKEAKSSCEKAIALDHGFEEAYYLMGEAVKQESHEKAIEYYKKAIEIDPDYQASWQALGRVLTAKKKSLKEGIAALRKAIKLDPEDGWAQIYLANALWKMGDIQKADKWYKSAIKTYPDFKDLRKWYDDFLKSTRSSN